MCIWCGLLHLTTGIAPSVRFLYFTSQKTSSRESIFTLLLPEVPDLI